MRISINMGEMLVILLIFFVILLLFYFNDMISKFNHLMFDLLIWLNSTFQEIDNRINTIENSVNNTYIRVENLEKRVSSLEKNIKNEKVLRYPSYQELVSFVMEDDTDRYQYVEGKFVCTDFSNLFIKRFAEKGYFSCLVVAEIRDEINNVDGAHAFVSVKLDDGRIFYVEPQSDKIFEDYILKPGVNYCDVVGWQCVYRIKRVIDCFHI